LGNIGLPRVCSLRNNHLRASHHEHPPPFASMAHSASHRRLAHRSVELRRSVRATSSKVASVHGASACGAARALGDHHHLRRAPHVCSAQPRFAPAQDPGPCAADARVVAPSARIQHHLVSRGCRSMLLNTAATASTPRFMPMPLTFPSSPCRAPTRPHPCGFADAPPPRRRLLTTAW
jgi:hypothetical protein